MKSNIEKTQVTCNLCGADNYTRVAQGRDHEYDTTTDDTFNVVKCNECELVYLNPRPAVSELSTIYPPDYYAYQLFKIRQQSSQKSDSVLASIIRYRNIKRYRRVAETLGIFNKDTVKVLDIGCGDGSMLIWWRDAFPEKDIQTFGVEMNSEAAEVAIANGHEVWVGRLEDVELPADEFDLIYSSHVIEHVTDPTEFLEKSKVAMKADGVMMLDTPNVNCMDYRIFRRGKWGGYHFPRHFNLFDDKTITKLAEKTSLNVKKISYLPNAIFWIWTLHDILQDRFKPLADRLFPPVKIFTEANVFNFFVLTFFTLVDYTIVLIFRKSSTMRVFITSRDSN